MIKKPKYYTTRSIHFSLVYEQQVLVESYYHNGYLAKFEIECVDHKYKDSAI